MIVEQPKVMEQVH
jgi:hypothetical protein